MKTPYETLRETVYKILYPDGIPLEFGDNFGFKDGVRDCTFLWRDNKYFHFIFRFPLLQPKYDCLRRKHVDGYIDIYGKPLSIADVLRALEKKYSEAHYVLQLDGHLLEIHSSDELGLSTFEATTIHINLALPLSDHENSEVCEALNNLLK